MTTVNETTAAQSTRNAAGEGGMEGTAARESRAKAATKATVVDEGDAQRASDRARALIPDNANLLPPGFVIEKARRRRVRLLGTVAVAFLMVLGVTTVAVRLATEPVGESAFAELNRARKEQATGAEALQSIQSQLRVVSSRLEARRSLAEQPDVSILLKLLASVFDQDTSLRQFQLKSTGIVSTRGGEGLRGGEGRRGPGGAATVLTAPLPGADREPRHFTLTLRGTSASEGGISRLTTRLRSWGLFDSVDLLRTGRDQTVGENAIAFEIVCQMYEPAPARVTKPEPAGAGTGGERGASVGGASGGGGGTAMAGSDDGAAAAGGGQ